MSRRHEEPHFGGGEWVRDVVIGMSDGLTVPFALAAGLSGAVADTGLIVVAGLAEIAAGSIAMGLGGYLAARTDEEHYQAELAREWKEVREMPDAEEREIEDILGEFGVPREAARPVVQALRARPDRWVDFMMRFELGLSRPDRRRALLSALTIALSYVLGGIVPLSAYMVIRHALTALATSAAVTAVALFAFGYVKGRLTGARPLRSGLQTTLVGGVAAAAAFLLARAIA